MRLFCASVSLICGALLAGCGGAVSGSAQRSTTTVPSVRHPHAPTTVVVADRAPSNLCRSHPDVFSGVHVVSAFKVSARQLRLAPISDSGRYGTHKPTSLWTVCFVKGRDVIPFGGPPGTAHRTTQALYVLDRSGSLAMMVGVTDPRFEIVPVHGSF